jgi:hypothetical protein
MTGDLPKRSPLFAAFIYLSNLWEISEEIKKSASPQDATTQDQQSFAFQTSPMQDLKEFLPSG